MCGATPLIKEYITNMIAVSMPHAALCVVQHYRSMGSICTRSCFNAARGFVCGATLSDIMSNIKHHGFNAARGFVCGATDLRSFVQMIKRGFNAARGFVCGATRI